MYRQMFMALALVTLSFSVPYGSADAGDAGRSVNSASLQIKLTLSRPYERDERTRNIYTIHVNQISPDEPTAERYRVLYFLDNRFIRSYEYQTLPFQFSRNLRAQEPGRHEIKVDIETLETNQVLASSSIDVIVE